MNIIEQDQKVNLQFSLLNQPKVKSKQNILPPFKVCTSKLHNTNLLICIDFYKKTF